MLTLKGVIGLPPAFRKLSVRDLALDPENDKNVSGFSETNVHYIVCEVGTPNANKTMVKKHSSVCKKLKSLYADWITVCSW